VSEWPGPYPKPPPRQPRTPKGLKRRKGLRNKTPRKLRVDIGGLLPQHDWETLNALVLARPLGGRCEWCGKDQAQDFHHRLTTAHGGPDVASNGASVSRICHGYIHDHPAEARGRGFLVPSGGDFRKRAMILWDGQLALIDDEGGYSWVSGQE
jgi:hypothetical protein